jgi:hypothetical protein
LGVEFASLGCLEKAIPLVESALESQKMVLGPDHPDVIAYTNVLVINYTQSRLWENASPLAKSYLELAHYLLSPMELPISVIVS